MRAWPPAATGEYLWWWNNTGLAAASTTTGAIVTHEFDPVSSSAPGLTFGWEQRLEFQFDDTYQECVWHTGRRAAGRQIDGQWYATADVYSTTDAGVSEHRPLGCLQSGLRCDGQRVAPSSLLPVPTRNWASSPAGDLVGNLTGIGFVATFSQYQTLNFNFVEFSLVELPGDYNGDDVVDAADYTVWRNNLGTTNVLPNDVTPGFVDESDYIEWKNNFGNALTGSASVSAGDSGAVPEPASFALVLSLIGLSIRRCGGKRRSCAADKSANRHASFHGEHSPA